MRQHCHLKISDMLLSPLSETLSLPSLSLPFSSFSVLVSKFRAMHMYESTLPLSGILNTDFLFKPQTRAGEPS